MIANAGPMTPDLSSFRAACLSMWAPTVVDTSTRLMDDYVKSIVPLFSDREFFITRIDSEPIRTRVDLFNSVSSACNLPVYFGANWNALKDCLLDFSWMPRKPNGYLLLYRHPELLNWSDLSEFIILCDRVRTIYAQHQKPFKLLMPQH